MPSLDIFHHWVTLAGIAMSDVSILRLKHMVAVFEADQGDKNDAGPILRSCGMSKTMMKDAMGRIAIRQEAEFVRRACEVLDDPVFAARAGLAYRDAATLTAYVAKSCDTLQQAMALASRYIALSDSDTMLTLEHLNDVPFLAVHSRTGTMDRDVRHREFLTFALVARLRRIAGAGFTPAGLAFRHDIRNHRATLEKLAGCRLYLEQERTGVLLTPSALNLPISTADPELRAYLSQHGDSLLKARIQDDQTLSEQVEAALLKNLPGRLPSADDVAAELGMSRRTMSRKLTDAKSPYRSILDKVRCDLAQMLLRDKHSIAETAFLLDYSDQAAFSTAFKRWTGMTPNSYRTSGSATGGKKTTNPTG